MKSRSNSRGSILDDFLNQSSGSRNMASSLNLSLCAMLGNSDYEPVSGPPHTSIFQCCNRIQESVCKCICNSRYVIQWLTRCCNLSFFSAFTSQSSLKIHKDISKYSLFQTVYCMIASRVRSVIPFVKVAYPDMTGGQSLNHPEPLNKMERAACRYYIANII